MAKDKGGHGSEKRGGEGSNYARQAPTKNGRARWYGSSMADRIYANELSRGRAPELAAATAGKGPRTPLVAALAAGTEDTPQLRASFSGGQPVTSDAHAAATLAGGPKSAPVDTHPSMAERPNAWGQYPKQAAEARAQLRSDRKQQLNKPPSQRRSYP